MKIGIDARMIKATGIGRYTLNLVEQLAKIDSPLRQNFAGQAQNQYFLFLKKEEFDTFKAPAPNFKKVLADFHWYGLSEQRKFPKIIKSCNLDLMHFPHFNVPFLYKGKFLITIHDLTLHRYKTIRASTKSFLTYQAKHSAYKFIIKNAVKRALKILVPSNFTKEDVKKTFKTPEEKNAVTYEGGPSSELLNKKPDNNILEKFHLKSPFVLYVGNAYPHKNIETLVQSLKYLPKDVTLVLVGKIDEFYERIKRLVESLGIQKQVVFTDFVTDSELAALYKSADLYVFPSFNEGFGLPALEAMGFGLPVLSSGYSSLPEILEDAALYFNPKDPKDIAEKIAKVTKDQKLKQELIDKGFKQVEKYSWNRMAKETLKVYEKVLE